MSDSENARRFAKDCDQVPLLVNLRNLKYELRLEMKGVKYKGKTRGSAYAYVKKRFGLRGSRESVYAQFCQAHGLEE